MKTNRLAEESSPYLLQHKHNPVDWYPWSEEAFERARREMKIVFLSIGYSACHWCHVMERESFEDEGIAAVLNEHFVSIKVDREERPDVDGLYMEVVQRLTGRGGWPLTVFMLPDARPVYGGTYFPPEDRYGHPGFRRLLESIAKIWQDTPDQLVQNAEQLSEGMGDDLMARLQPGALDEDVLKIGTGILTGEIDLVNGGFGGAPKFPQAANIRFLLKESVIQQDDKAKEGALLTLRKMAEGGIYDQLGGGFHRYSTDDVWLVPHFEKMLYDQALLVPAYLHAFQLTGEPLFRRIAEETLAYVKREMTNDRGGFYAAQDADSEGVEGKFFVWSLDEVVDVLGERDGLAFATYYDITGDGNWEGSNILNVKTTIEHVAETFDLEVTAVEEILQRGREKLLAVRERRVKPGLDDKSITAWNAMMASAFAEAYHVLRDERYLDTALTNVRFLFDNLMTPDGRLHHTWKKDEARFDAFLDDYAYLAEASVNLFELTGDWSWLDRAVSLADEMLALFWDDKAGGFFYTREDTELIARRKELMDNATPSGNSVAAYVLARLAVHTGREDYRESVGHILEGLASAMRKYPGAFGYILEAAGFVVRGPVEVAIIGGERDAFLAELSRTFVPYRLVVAGATAEDRHPLLAGRDVSDGTRAFVCRDYSCLMPAEDLDTFREQLQASAAVPQ